MHSAFVKINGVPTKVTCWGKWIEEGFDDNDCKDIVLMITGNPGITTYYHKFLETVYLRTGYHVWILSHAGHEVPDEPTTMLIPSLQENEQLYNLQGQINHKIEFVKKYVPNNCRLHIMGHSIGAYMCLSLLNDLELNPVIQRTFLLFPTLEHMATTPNGRFYCSIVQRLQLVLLFLAYIFTMLPLFVRSWLTKIVLYILGTDTTFVTGTLMLTKPIPARHIMFLADDEMARVHSRNDAVITANRHKIIAYYGRQDGWAPEAFYQQLRRDVPGVRAELAPKEFAHAYVLKSSKEMGLVVANWLTEY